MTNEHQSPGPDSPETTALRAMIARRKRVDLMFALLGVLLVIASLSVLVVLFGQLAGDGARRLTTSHMVKTDGVAPGRKELGGTLKRLDSPAGEQWLLVRPPLAIRRDSLPKDLKFQDLAGRKVALTADMPEAGTFEVDPSDVKEIQEFSNAYTRESVEGTLEKRPTGWYVKPPDLALDLSKVETEYKSLEGQSVAIDPGRSKSLPLSVRGVEKLVPQH